MALPSSDSGNEFKRRLENLYLLDNRLTDMSLEMTVSKNSV